MNGGGFRGNKWWSKASREEGSILGVRSGLGVVGNAWTGGGSKGRGEREGGARGERVGGQKNANSQTCKLLKSPPLNLIFYN